VSTCLGPHLFRQSEQIGPISSRLSHEATLLQWQDRTSFSILLSCLVKLQHDIVASHKKSKSAEDS
jgi:hypothetical protein